MSELPEGKPHRLEHEGYGVVVVRTASGVSAYEDVCPHAGWRLSDGELVDGLLECPGHGWQFRIQGGRCVDVPFYCLKQLAVTQADGMVRVEWVKPGKSDGAAAV
ncbi:MAG TPA: Rieske 2Fe-2S domain-containing protein [Candidatus Polarisedimenticolia bacterium]|nr:Rieske 2Fe-2S domain-containing protein [Candidatus Polarisedimenticolia bacterium]